MIHADRELLAGLARMNSDVVPFAMKIMDNSATVEEQRTFANRLLELDTRLNHRARQSELVIDCDTVEEPPREPCTPRVTNTSGYYATNNQPDD